MSENIVNIIGAGMAGLSAAITLAQRGIKSRLISLTPSEQAQSVLAEGGINGAVDVMGEEDTPAQHVEDTLKAGVYIADRAAVKGLCEKAPAIIMWLRSLGVPFNMENGHMIQRNFGGQKKKRTAYAKSLTGKIIMSALIDEARKFEEAGLITRYCSHSFSSLIFKEEEPGKRCAGVRIVDLTDYSALEFEGNVIMACGGLNGFFPEMTTGTVPNNGDAAATLFGYGVRFSSLEMIQYHPTTMGIPGKRALVTEAARGEGGRLCIYRDAEGMSEESLKHAEKVPDSKRYLWYFMEERHPELGNLSPRDVVAREMFFVTREFGEQVYLDMRHLPKKTWKNKLPDLREEIIHYHNIDPKDELVPVEPGIHYFMGGIDVNSHHRTNIEGLYAAGECCSQYHGANRLGGNSMLGAIYGGNVAANYIADRNVVLLNTPEIESSDEQISVDDIFQSDALKIEIRDILLSALGIVRNEADILKAEQAIEDIMQTRDLKPIEKKRALLAKAMLLSAAFRKESRGAHYREDYPEKDDNFLGMVTAILEQDEIKIELRPVRDEHADEPPLRGMPII